MNALISGYVNYQTAIISCRIWFASWWLISLAADNAYF